MVDCPPEIYAVLESISLVSGSSILEVVEDWHQRAAIREHLAGVDRATADDLAVDDVRARHCRQRSLL